jgi:hypothetical protein
MKVFLSIIKKNLSIQKNYFFIVIKFDHQVNFVESNHLMNPLGEKLLMIFHLHVILNFFFNCKIIFIFKNSMWMAIPINKLIF